MNRMRSIVRWLDEYTLWAFNPDPAIIPNQTHVRLPRAR
jgi:hypothetical protein